MRLPIVLAWFPLRAPRPPGCDGAVRAAVLPRPALVCYVEARSGHQRTRNPDTGAGNPPAAYGGAQCPARGNPAPSSDQTLPTPDTLPLIVTSLQEMVSLSGMQSSHFVPRRRNRRGKEPHPSGRHPFRPSRQFPAPCPPAERTAVAFRHGILNVTPSGALPAYSLGIWATFTQQANTPRH